MQKDIFSELKWRGLVYQTTDDPGIQQWLVAKPRTLYAGFDPTAESLHVGSLLPLMTLRRFQDAGHRPIAVVGGATGMIGDPSGKSAERNLLSPEQLKKNVTGLEQQMRKFLAFDGVPNPAILVNNHDWIGKISFVDFLRDVGKNFSVNVMLAKDSVKSRIEGDEGISYTEFSYMLLQAYDFVHLNRTHQCELQIGGSDQWGNITAGIDLGRRMNSAQLYGITCPLLTKSDGSKMGKTESGTVWLSADKTSPYQFFQYWLNVADADVGRCLRFLTLIPPSEIEALESAHASNPQSRPCQISLATWLTKFVHGDDGFAKAQEASSILFGSKIESMSDRELNQIFADVPNSVIPRATLNEGLSLLDAIVQTGLAKSKNEARRSVGEGGIYINNSRVDDPNYVLTTRDLASESAIVLRKGKKSYAILKLDG